jgi:hypothetical protein
VREEEPGAVASAPVEEPTEAAALTIVLLPDNGDQDSTRGTISAPWMRLRRAIHLPAADRSHH